MLELEPYFYFNAYFWLILGIALIILDIFLISTMFILPFGISACLIAILLGIESRGISLPFFDGPIFTSWEVILLTYSIISIIISIFLIKFVFQRKNEDVRDINDY